MCQSDEDERASHAHPGSGGHLATIAALLDVSVESLRRDEAAPRAPQTTPAGDYDELVALFFDLDPARRLTLLDAARRLARGEMVG